MDPSPHIQQLALTSIGRRCAQETENFFNRQKNDPRYCFELFRRAILERSQHAWELICTQYQPIVAKWVERHPSFSATGEEIAYFVNSALTKMWLMITPDKFDHFSDLKSLLRYLQLCVNSVVIDYLRSRQHIMFENQVELSKTNTKAADPMIEDQAIAKAHREELWQSLNRHLRNEQEYRVIYASFILALKPRQILAEFSDTFHTVNEIYRIKENVIARLRRDAEFKKYFFSDEMP